MNFVLQKNLCDLNTFCWAKENKNGVEVIEEGIFGLVNKSKIPIKLSE